MTVRPAKCNTWVQHEMRAKDSPSFGCASCRTDFCKGLGTRKFADLAMFKLIRIRAVYIPFVAVVILCI